MINKYFLKRLPWKSSLILLLIIWLFLIAFFTSLNNLNFENYISIPIAIIFVPILVISFFNINFLYKDIFENSFLNINYKRESIFKTFLIVYLVYGALSFFQFLLIVLMIFILEKYAIKNKEFEIEFKGIIFSGFLVILWSIPFVIFVNNLFNKKGWMINILFFAFILLFGFIIVPITFFIQKESLPNVIEITKKLETPEIVKFQKTFNFLPLTANTFMLTESFFGTSFEKINDFNIHLWTTQSQKLYNIFYPIIIGWFLIFGLWFLNFFKTGD